MADPRKILVTGGAGFIGIHVVEELQRRGHTAFVYDNLSFARRSLVPVPDSRFMRGDIRDLSQLETAFDRFVPDVVIHLAAIHFIPYCNAHPYEAADVNIRGTMNVLDAAAMRTGMAHVLFASTAAVYPIADGPLSEESPTGPLDIYGLTKLTGERLCREYFLRSGKPTTVVRFFNAFGTKETNPHLIPEIHKQVLGGARRLALGNLAPKRDFIHTTDMAKALAGLVEAAPAGYDIYNLGSGAEYSVTDVVDAFSRALGEKLVIDVDPARVRKVERMHLLADVSKLKAFTGWAPKVSLQEGIRTLVREGA